MVVRAEPAWGSIGLDDGEFVRRLEACEYPNGLFRHADHVRLAWIYVRWCGPAAEARIVESIQRYARSLSHPGKYHDTITRAWLRLVAAAHAATPQIGGFGEFAARHPELLDRDRLGAFYSPRVIESDAARRAWVPPDVQPLPSLER